MPDFVFQRKLGLDMLKAATGAALFELTRQWRLSLVQPLKKKTTGFSSSGAPDRTGLTLPGLPVGQFHADMWSGAYRGRAEMSCSCVAGGA